jgi:hypothetical protein
LLFVHGTGEPTPEVITHGSLFQHDPNLQMTSTFGREPVRLVSSA